MTLRKKFISKKSIFSSFMLILMLGAALLFASCDNLFENEVPEENQNEYLAGAGETELEPEPIEISGQLIFNGAVPQKLISNEENNDSSRAAIPNFTSSEVDYFAVATSGTGANAKTMNGTFGTAGSANASTFSILLIPGRTWTITCGIKVKNSTDASDRLLTAVLPNVNPSEIASGTTLKFFPVPDTTDTSATGQIALSMSIDASITSVSLAANNEYSTGWPSSLNSATITPGSTTATINASVPVGTYEILMSFFDTDNNLLYASVQNITVCKGLTTRTWISSGGDSPINSSGVFSVTAAKIRTFTSTNFYVGDTGAANAVPASNDNSGSHKAPFLTFDKALSVVQSLTGASGADTTREYTIHICGTVDNSETTTVPEIGSGLNGNMAKLIIKGRANTTNPPVLQNPNTTGRVLNIETTVPVEIEGLKITGGNADSSTGPDGYGGGLYLSGTNTNVTLNNSVIEANLATIQGGGVYIASGAKLTMKGSAAAIKDNEVTRIVSIGAAATPDAKTCGGGIFVAEGGTLQIDNGTVSGNVTTDAGGGIYVRGDFTLNKGTITSNKRVNGTDGFGPDPKTSNIEMGTPGHFIMNGGTITSTIEYGWNGAAVNIYLTNNDPAGTATFDMNGGSITGLYFRSGAVKMRGYAANCNVVFNMNGGSITGNHATDVTDTTDGYGGAVYIGSYSEFNMTGGEISGNEAAKLGGAVYINGGSVTLGKSGSTSTVKIKNNTSGTSNATDNVHLETDQTITVAGALSTNSEVGVTKYYTTVPLTSGFASTNSGTTPSDIFTSDEGFDVIASTQTGSVGEASLHIEDRFIPLTLEAASGAVTVTFDNKATGVVAYRINGGALQTIGPGTTGSIDLNTAGSKVQFFGDNAKYGASGYTDCSRINCSDDCYVYGNIMSLVSSTNFASANELTESYAFTYLFRENTNLMNHSDKDLLLPATTLYNACYRQMFCGCSKLERAPVLPATSLETECYEGMFRLCSSLVTAPALPATTLARDCYRTMFEDCTSLVTAPALPAATLVSYCYYYMFKGCTSLNNVTCLATNISASDCTTNWLSTVATAGTFKKAAGMNDWTTGVNGIPEGWTVDEPPVPLTLEAVSSAATITFRNTANGAVTYIVNGGEPQTIAKNTTGTIELSAAGDKVEFFGDNTSYGSLDYNQGSRISCSADCYIYGNIMSLVSSTDFENADTLTGYYAFANFFYQNKKLKNKTGVDLLLPATTLTTACYNSMFYECSGLTRAPTLPATILTERCYEYMFYKCSGITIPPSLPATSLAKECYDGMLCYTGITTAPNLPATTLAVSCYRFMFSNCTNLTAAPELPSTTLANYCYQNMFEKCTSLTVAPELPATTLKTYCYSSMFSGCTGLTTAPELPAEIMMEGCYSSMFEKCTNLASAPELPATTLAKTCYCQMFKGCKSIITAPNLPATTLTDDCYSAMFSDCTGLTTAPVLSVETLTPGCYGSMFSGCTSLTAAPALPATTLASSCYYGMFQGCTSLTEAPILPAPTLVTYCYKDMFKGCRNLNSVTCLATDISANYCTSTWLSNVASSGTFTKAPAMTDWPLNSPSGIPSGWTVVGTYLGSKAPGAEFAAGDIVFSDGSAEPYTDTLTLTPEQAAAAIAVIFYRGTDLNKSGDTSSRTLGVGLIQKANLAWGAPEDTNNAIPAASAIGKDITAIQGNLTSGDKYGKDNLSDISAFLTDSGYTNDTTTLSRYPVFNYAANYKNEKLSGESSSRLAGTAFEDEWYIPTIQELNQIYLIKDTINAALDLCGGAQMTASYWSSNQNSDYNSNANNLTFSNGNMTANGTGMVNGYQMQTRPIREF